MTQTTFIHLALPAVLSFHTVDQVRQALAAAPDPDLPVVLDGRAVTEVDPVGALRLWQFCRDRLLRHPAGVTLEGFRRDVLRRLRHHPLLTLIADGEHLFGDPFASAESGR